MVLVGPFPDAILVKHVSTNRLVAVRDPSPPMGEDMPKRRHVWVDVNGGYQSGKSVAVAPPPDLFGHLHASSDM